MYVLPQLAVQRLIQAGIKRIKEDPRIIEEIFASYLCDEFIVDYGQSKIDEIKTWFLKTHIPVVQSWGIDPTKVPMISVHLASESEDESKAAFDDHFGMGEEGDIGINNFSTMLDINLLTSKNGEQVLWLYYITSYILFKNKRLAEKMGMRLQTFNATDYTRDLAKMSDQVWVRSIRFRCTTSNFWSADPFITIDDLKVRLFLEPAEQ